MPLQRRPTSRCDSSTPSRRTSSTSCPAASSRAVSSARMRRRSGSTPTPPSRSSSPTSRGSATTTSTRRRPGPGRRPCARHVAARRPRRRRPGARARLPVQAGLARSAIGRRAVAGGCGAGRDRPPCRERLHAPRAPSPGASRHHAGRHVPERDHALAPGACRQPRRSLRREAPKSPLRLVVAPTGRCWVQVSADGQMRVAREVSAGERITIDAAERLQIIVGDAGNFAYEFNGRPGKALGAAGRVARATILPSTRPAVPGSLACRAPRRLVAHRRRLRQGRRAARGPPARRAWAGDGGRL